MTIFADLTRFWNDHKVGLVSGDALAELNMTVAVKTKEGAALFSRQLLATGTQANTMIMGGENAKIALNRALENGMRELFDDKAFQAALQKGAD